MENVLKAIKCIVMIWIAYPIASILWYFEGSRQEFGWIPGAIAGVALTIGVIIYFAIEEIKKRKTKVIKDLTYDDFINKLKEEPTSFEFIYRHCKLTIYKLEKVFVCEISSEEEVISKHDFLTIEELLFYKMIANQTLQELWPNFDEINMYNN